MSATRSIRILVQFDWPTDEITRLWDGAGPLIDGDLNVWHGCSLGDDLDGIEQAINGEAHTLNMTLTNVAAAESNLAWLAYTNEQIVGATVRIMIQPCDADDQPIGDREVQFTGRIDNVVFDDAVADEQPRSAITVEVVNRFTMRRLKSGSVLSDADQQARSAALNPGEDPDRLCERVPLLQDKTITWPRWN